MELNFKKGNTPGLQEKFELDIYRPVRGTQSVQFNDRTIRKDKIVLDPPHVLHMNNLDYAIPSDRDMLALKMDIFTYSNSGLREKDILDILTLFKIQEREGITNEELESMFMGIIEGDTSILAKQKLQALLDLLAPYIQSQINLVPPDYPFYPSNEHKKRMEPILRRLIRKS